MNRQIPRIGAAIVCAMVFLFAVCLIVDFSFGAYFVCMLLPLGYIMMAAGFQHEAEEDRKVAANVGLVFSAVYVTLILLVYFAQTTSVRLDGLGDGALRVLDFRRGGPRLVHAGGKQVGSVAEAAADAPRRVLRQLLRAADDGPVSRHGGRRDQPWRGNRPGDLVRLLPACGPAGLAALRT